MFGDVGNRSGQSQGKKTWLIWVAEGRTKKPNLALPANMMVPVIQRASDAYGHVDRGQCTAIKPQSVVLLRVHFLLLVYLHGAFLKG